MSESTPRNESNPAGELSPSERRALKARAHGLEPVVLVGDKGLTSAVLAEIDRALAAHELIKVRVQAERGDRAGMLAEICAGTKASAVQQIGRMLVVYRKRPPGESSTENRAKVRKAAARKAKARQKPDPKADRRSARRPRATTKGTSGVRGASKGTGRPGSRTASPRRAPARPLRRQRTSR